MTDTQDVMHVKQFKDNIIQAVQQTNSILDRTVRRKDAMRADSLFFNKLGSIDLSPKEGRNAPTPFFDPIHTRRKLTTGQFNKAIAIDSFDVNRTNITGLDSDYMKALMMGAKRKKDELIIAAATGIAYEGKDGQTASVFPTANIVPAGATGLTSDKILNGLEIIRAADVDEDEKLFCAITAKQENDLLKDNKIINSDFTRYAVLEKGIIGQWAGINFVRTNKLLLNASAERQVLLYTDTALGLGIAKEVTTKMSENPERSYTPTIYIEVDMGATRIEDEKIVQIPCVE